MIPHKRLPGLVMWRPLRREARADLERAAQSGTFAGLVDPDQRKELLDDFCRIARPSDRGADDRALHDFIATYGSWGACDSQYEVGGHRLHPPLSVLLGGSTRPGRVYVARRGKVAWECLADVRDSAVRLNALRRLAARLRDSGTGGLSKAARQDALDVFGMDQPTRADIWVRIYALMYQWFRECHVVPVVGSSSVPNGTTFLLSTDGPAAALAVEFADELENPQAPRYCADPNCELTWRRARLDRTGQPLCEQCSGRERQARKRAEPKKEAPR